MSTNQRLLHTLQQIGFRSAGGGELRLDAGEVFTISRQLDNVLAEVYSTLFAPLLGRQLVPTRTLPPGASANVYWTETDFGEAKIIANAADDLPSGASYRQEVREGLRTIGFSYDYSVMDLQSAAYTGEPLDASRARSAREFIERKMDDVIALGDSDFGLTGLLNKATVPVLNLATATGTPAWTSATSALDMLKGLNLAVQTVVDNTRTLLPPTDLVLDTASFSLINSTLISTAVPQTVYATFLATNPYIRTVSQWERANAAAVGAGPRWVVYRKDPSILDVPIAQEFTVLDPQPRNLSLVIPCMAKIGSVSFKRPDAVLYVDRNV